MHKDAALRVLVAKYALANLLGHGFSWFIVKNPLNKCFRMQVLCSGGQNMLQERYWDMVFVVYRQNSASLMH